MIRCWLLPVVPAGVGVVLAIVVQLIDSLGERGKDGPRWQGFASGGRLRSSQRLVAIRSGGGVKILSAVNHKYLYYP